MKLNFPGHSLCHVFLHREDVFCTAVIALRPKMGLVLYSNKLYGEAQAVGAASEAAFQHILDGELTTNLIQTLVTVLVPHDRGSRDHTQLLGTQAPQLGN